MANGSGTDNDMITVRSWEALRDEVQGRADAQRYPLTGMTPEDVRAALAATGSKDRDAWAAGWSGIGDRYRQQADGQVDSDSAAAAENYLMAWRYHGFAAWPTQNTAAKQDAFEKSLDDFRRHAALASPAIERLQAETPDGPVTFYLQLPEDAPRPVPVLLSYGGLDSYKEYIVERYGPDYLANGFGYAALDIPGTGESPIRAAPDAIRIYSAVIDYLQTRDDVDSSRLAVQGVSQGGYWAARLAIAEAERLAAAVYWAGPTHETFQRPWLEKSTNTTEYLFDYLPARLSIYGAASFDEYLDIVPSMSIETLGLADAPTPEMLLINGEKDSQTSIGDLYLLLRNGLPKYAWVNPDGGHLGRSASWPDERILREVIIPFLKARLLT
ncbi:MAG: alpha/beta fold hydrolase [Alphaproteobacteria bacterium]|jgi:esterase FrsA